MNIYRKSLKDMNLKFLRFLPLVIVIIGMSSTLQSCSDNDDEMLDAPQQSGIFDLQASSGTGYNLGKVVSVVSEKGPKKGQSHRSSDNFSTYPLDDKSYGGTPACMVVVCPDGITFDLQVDKTGKDETWNDDVYNGAILPYRGDSKFYISNPSGANGNFTVKFVALYPVGNNTFVSSPGRHLDGQKHRSSLNFVLPTGSARYVVHCSDPSVSFGIYEDKTAANDDKIAHNVKDGDIINLSNSKRNYYMTDPENAKGLIQVRFEPAKEAWMDGISDDTSIADISMAGTHDAGTYALEPLNFGFSKCQNMDIDLQLKFGVRFFDLRVDGSMNIEHGGLPCNVSFDEVVRTTCNFLKNNPSETVIFEITGDDGFKDDFNSYLKNHSDYASRFWTKNNVPKLKDVRGKIMIVRRYSYNGEQGLDFYSSNVWPDDTTKKGTNADGVEYYIEDRYFSASSTDSHDTHVKRDLLLEGIDYKGSHPGVFSMNFASVSASASHTPYMFMWGGGTPGVDPVISNVLSDKFKSLGSDKHCVGIIVMDYFNNNGHDDNMHVVEQIINSNYPKNSKPFDITRIHSIYD